MTKILKSIWNSKKVGAKNKTGFNQTQPSVVNSQLKRNLVHRKKLIPIIEIKLQIFLIMKNKALVSNSCSRKVKFRRLIYFTNCC